MVGKPKFGLGTTFGGIVYHAFEGTHVTGSNSPRRFELKCAELIHKSAGG